MPDNYFARYLPLLMQLGIALLLAGGMVLLSTLLGKRRYSLAKFQPYECGITPTGDARERFSVKFYLVAMLFILFDVEAVFLYPWAIIFKDELRMFGFWEMLVFLGIVLVGFFYIWKKGALDWSQQERIGAGLSSTPATMRAPADAPGETPAFTVPVEGSKS